MVRKISSLRESHTGLPDQGPEFNYYATMAPRTHTVEQPVHETATDDLDSQS